MEFYWVHVHVKITIVARLGLDGEVDIFSQKRRVVRSDKLSSHNDDQAFCWLLDRSYIHIYTSVLFLSLTHTLA